VACNRPIVHTQDEPYVNIDQQWIEIHRRKLKDSEKNLLFYPPKIPLGLLPKELT
jgi:hypothetical protein